ncbi:MAG: YidB family protein [Burkholderiaceae bacterium]
MYEVLIREAAVRFGLGDKALPVLQMLLAYMTAKDSGGLVGFLEKFKAAGLGPLIQSWLGGGPSAQPISNSQLETVLGSSGGLLSLVSGKLELGRDNVTSALGYLLPALVGKLTPGGSMPSNLPPEVQSLAEAGQQLIAAPSPAELTSGGIGGSLLSWLPWVVVVLAALFGLSYCGKDKGGSAPPAVEAPASAPAPAASTPATPAAAASQGAPASVEPATPASEAAPAAAPASEPETPASAVVSGDTRA